MNVWFYLFIGLLTVMVYAVSIVWIFKVAHIDDTKGVLETLLGIIQWVFLPITLLVFLVLNAVDSYKEKMKRRKGNEY